MNLDLWFLVAWVPFPFLFHAEIEQASKKVGERRDAPVVHKKLGRNAEGNVEELQVVLARQLNRCSLI